MDTAYGRSLVANQNMYTNRFTERETRARYTTNSREMRCNRLDSTVMVHQPRFSTPRQNCSHMYTLRLEPRNAIYQFVIEKNAATTTRNAFQDEWRTPNI